MAEARAHVFGSPVVFRSQVRRRLSLADGLRARVESARDQLPEFDPNAKGILRALQLLPHTGELSAVEESVATWRAGNNRVVKRYLGAAGDRFSVSNSRPWSEERDPAERAEMCERAIDEGAQMLEKVLSVLPTIDSSVRPVEQRFSELAEAGLVETELLSEYQRRMSKLRTRAQISDAIGAAKELVEACNRATCDLLGKSYPKDDMGKLGKIVRKELAHRDRAAPSPIAENAISQLFAGIATVEQALATLRNELGTGHGRSKLPAGHPTTLEATCGMAGTSRSERPP